MAFTNLSQTTQDLLNQQFIFIAKGGVLTTFLVFSLLMIFYFKPKKTAILGTKIIRGIAYYTSWVYVVAVPMLIFLLSPAVPLDVVVAILLVFYGLLSVIVMIVFTTNIIFYGTYFLTDLLTGENNYERMSKEVTKPFR